VFNGVLSAIVKGCLRDMPSRFKSVFSAYCNLYRGRIAEETYVEQVTSVISECLIGGARAPSNVRIYD